VYPIQGSVSIPIGESRQIRLRFDTRTVTVNPGQYTFNIRLRDLNNGYEKLIPGTLEVWNFQLPSYDVVQNNSYVEFNNSEFSGGQLLAKAVAHMKLYGLNVVFIHPSEMPVPVVDANGNLLRFNGSAFESRVSQIVNAWKAAPGNETVTFVLGGQMI
jgi:hypothetical protein